MSDRDEAIATIRAELRRRSGRTWSVTGGRGTSWGWLTITAPPARRERGVMTDADAAELGTLLALGHSAHGQGVLVPASSAHRREYVERAAGRPAVETPAYWD